MIKADTPMEVLIAALAFIVAIGLLVAVHEFGHFWVARRLGIRVLRFSIGFGKPLWKKVVGTGDDTVEYVVAGIPLGGYVKLLDEREGEVPAAQAHRAFNRQPVWKRIAVLLAGPAFNLVFAVFLYWTLFVAGVPTLKPLVGEVRPDSIAASAGLEYEDLILSVGGKRTETIENAVIGVLQDLVDDGRISMRVRDASGDERTIELDAGDRRRELTQAETMLPGLGFDFWRPKIRPIVGDTSEEGAARQAGVLPGDEILAVDDQPVGDFTALVKLISPRPNETVALKIRRNDAVIELKVAVREGKLADGRTGGQLGIMSIPDDGEMQRAAEKMRALEKYGPLDAVGAAAAKTWDMSTFTLKMVGRIVTGDVSLKNISGPISIAETAGFAARLGWRDYLTSVALISISLGVLNLLPIPILDGGQIVYQLAELVKGRPVSERAQIFGQQIGIAMLLLMMSLAFYNDIARHLN